MDQKQLEHTLKALHRYWSTLEVYYSTAILQGQPCRENTEVQRGDWERSKKEKRKNPRSGEGWGFQQFKMWQRNSG